MRDADCRTHVHNRLPEYVAGSQDLIKMAIKLNPLKRVNLCFSTAGMIPIDGGGSNVTSFLT